MINNMNLEKKSVGGGVAWVRKQDYEWENKKYEADLKNGDKVTILDEGTLEPQSAEYGGGEREVFKIETRNGEKKIAPNPKSLNILIDAFGGDTANWVNKEVSVLTVKTLIGGKKVVVAYLTDGNWELDDFGDLVQTNVKNEAEHDASVDSQMNSEHPIDASDGPF